MASPVANAVPMFAAAAPIGPWRPRADRIAVSFFTNRSRAPALGAAP